MSTGLWNDIHIDDSIYHITQDSKSYFKYVCGIISLYEYNINSMQYLNIYKLHLQNSMGK